jgi:hypothetical protein
MPPKVQDEIIAAYTSMPLKKLADMMKSAVSLY